MNTKIWLGAFTALALLGAYDGAQPGLYAMRSNQSIYPGTTNTPDRYGPSMEWLDRAVGGGTAGSTRFKETRLDFKTLSSMMIAGIASGFRSQVANLLWMKFDEYFHEGQTQRQIPVMEAVVTLDPNFIDAWETIGWHWAYNIYADVPDDKKFKKNPKLIRAEQERVVDLGLDYLKRGASANPDTYRLWFTQAWIRSEKAGLYDQEAINLFKEAAKKPDSRDIKMGDSTDVKQRKIQGMDVVNQLLAQMLIRIPDLDQALPALAQILRNNYSSNFTPQQLRKRAITNEHIQQLAICGEYWGRFGTNYTDLVSFYNSSDAVIRARIKNIIPDIERMVKAQRARDYTGAMQPTPTGAYVSIVARYLPTWKLMKAGETQRAIRTIIGVMNVEPQYHLQDLDKLARVLELRGDSAQAIEKLVLNSKEVERTATQQIGLHLLARLYEKAAADTSGNPQRQREFNRLAYETWYRAREADALNFYAKTNTYRLQDKYGFAPPQKIIDEVAKARAGGRVPIVAPPPTSK